MQIGVVLISCEDVDKCRRQKSVCNTCHSPLEVEDETKTKKNILNYYFVLNLLLHLQVSLNKITNNHSKTGESTDQRVCNN